MKLFKNYSGLESINKRRAIKNYQTELSRVEIYKIIY